MAQHPLEIQIAALEAQIRSLREALVALPREERARADAEDVRSPAVMAAAPGDSATSLRLEGRVMAPSQEEAGVVWTAERTTRLYAINTALSVVLTEAQAAEVVLTQALPALGADGGLVISTNGEVLRLVFETGGQMQAASPPCALPTDNASLFEEVVRTGQAVWIETPLELKARYPSWDCVPWSLAGAIAAVPLIAQGRIDGLMAFRFTASTQFTIADRAFVLVLAQQCAAAFERAHLYEQVRRAAATEERNRLARDLHDSVSQALYSIVLSVAVGRKHHGRDAERVARVLDNIALLAEGAQADLRALLFDLRADSVAQTGLVNSLRERAQFMRMRHGIDVQVDVCEEPSLDRECKEALYAIAREALHNAAKHASASRIDLHLAQSAEAVTLEIRDDGIGFEPAATGPRRYGLQSIRERALEHQVTLRIDSAPGRGTRVLAVVPVSNAVEGRESRHLGT